MGASREMADGLSRRERHPAYREQRTKNFMESELIDWLRRRLLADPRAPLGFGDDAAVVDWSGAAVAGNGRLVVTVDTVTDQVDFRLDEIEPWQAGHKALGVNLSDLAAMAAEPIGAVISLVLPRQGGAGRSTLQLGQELYEGIVPLAEKFDVAIVGGDTNAWDGPLAISVTAFGRTTPRGPLTRGGAKPGDWLLVTGALGGSILGRHLAFEPRVREALLLNERYRLSAGMDVSDGLTLDASRLAGASGCGIAIDLTHVPISQDSRILAATSGKRPLEHALGDGEDFELLVTAPPDQAMRIVREQPLGIPVTAIGLCVDQPGLWERTPSGALEPLAAAGFLH